tara:strand:- start:21 stop:341 length:321 start_codon:yes stop_codon:yes gene_type:complete
MKTEEDGKKQHLFFVLETLSELCDSIHSDGGLISLDPQYDASEKWQGENGHLQALLPKLDVILPSENEAEGISGRQVRTKKKEKTNANSEQQYKKLPVRDRKNEAC